MSSDPSSIVSSSREGDKNSSHLQVLSCHATSLPQGIGKGGGISKLRSKLHPARKTVPTPLHKVDEQTLNSMPKGLSCSSRPSSSKGLTTLGQPGSSKDSGSHACPYTQPDSDDGCLRMGMVRDPPAPQSGGHMVPVSSLPFNKLEGTGNNKTNSSPLSPSRRKDDKGPVRQLHSPGLPEMPGLLGLHSSLDAVLVDS